MEIHVDCSGVVKHGEKTTFTLDDFKQAAIENNMVPLSALFPLLWQKHTLLQKHLALSQIEQNLCILSAMERANTHFFKGHLAFSSLREIFSVFLAVDLPPNYLKRSADAFSQTESSTLPLLVSKISELASCYQEYRRLLSKRAGTDKFFDQSIFSHNTLSAESFSHVFQGYSIVAHHLLIAQHNLSCSAFAALSLLKTLSTLLNSPYVGIVLPEVSKEPQLEQALTPFISLLHSFHDSNFEEEFVPLAAVPSEDVFPLSFVRGKTRLFVPRSSLEEAIFIADRIEHLVKNNIPLHNIAVASTSPIRTYRIAQELLQRGIPSTSLYQQGQQNPLFSAPFPFRLLCKLYALSKEELMLPESQILLRTSLLNSDPSIVQGNLLLSPEKGPFQEHLQGFLLLWQGMMEQIGNQNVSLPKIHLLLKHTFDQAAWLKLRQVYNRREFIIVLQKLLLAPLSWESAEVKPPSESPLSTLSLGHPTLLSTRSYSHLFCAGMIRGEIPHSSGEDAFFSDEDRISLNQRLGKPYLPLRRLSLRQIPLDFATLFAKSEEVYLSIPQLDSQNRPAAPCSYFEDLFPYIERIEPKNPEASAPQNIDQISTQHSLIEKTGEDKKEPVRSTLHFLQHRFQMEASREAWLDLCTKRKVPWALFTASRGLIMNYLGHLSSSEEQILSEFSRFGSTKNPMSVSAFELYARCPFRFYVEQVLHIETPETASEDIDVKTLGQIYHQVLQKAYQRQQPNLPLQGNQDELDALQFSIDEVLLSEEGLHQATHPGLLSIHSRRLYEDLSRFLRKEAISGKTSSDPEPLVPSHFEVPFLFDLGRLVSPPEKPPLSFLIRGKIDRIDVGQNKALILDYKLGRIEAYESILREQIGKTSFQLPIYVLALKHDPTLQADFQEKTISAQYYSIKQGVRSSRKVDSTTLNLPSVFSQIDHLRRGHFEILPKTCVGCGLKTACRIPKPLE